MSPGCTSHHLKESMQFSIQVVQVEKTTKPTAKGSYQMLEVAYKNLSSGKLESKKIMSFASDKAFKALADAKQGEQYTITSEKNDKTGYWDWHDASQAAPGAAPVVDAGLSTPSKALPAVRSTYETPEERAKKQVYIIKQSSISAALKMFELNKEKPTLDAVTALAQELTDWVFEQPSVNTPEPTLADMTDDIPY